MKLLIVRHGDPDYSIDSLTETGWKEAELLVPRLSKLDVKAFYVSPMGRAKDTAAPTLKAMGREAEVCPWLREFSASIRKPYEENKGGVWDWYPAEWTGEKRYFDRNCWMEPEPMKDSDVGSEWQWVTENFDALLARHGYVRQGDYYRAEHANEDTVVLFCHFGLQCVLLSHLLHVSPMVLWHGFCAAPSSVTTLVTEERQEGIAYFRMSSFGDVSHLYAAGQEPAFAARFCETFDNHDQRH
jgi:probable phosphoglycerate mutase